VYNIVYISEQNAELITEFLGSCKKSLETFRYYNKRNIKEAVQNHEVTIVSIIDDKVVGYGHLDPEADNMWLGICVADDYVGMGLGKVLMGELLKNVGQNIVLTVDNNNIGAIKLYERFGFVKKQDLGKILLMEKTYENTNI
jgi:ribosomal protein S18 acetylase RimI-like enzyme